MDSHKTKKSTKAELEEELRLLKQPMSEEQMKPIIDAQNKALSEERIRSIMIGFESANQMIMDYAKEHTIDEVIEFCKKNTESKSVMERVVSGEK